MPGAPVLAFAAAARAERAAPVRPAPAPALRALRALRALVAEAARRTRRCSPLSAPLSQTNQDAYLTLDLTESRNTALFGVFDGHGQNGHRASG